MGKLQATEEGPPSGVDLRGHGDGGAEAGTKREEDLRARDPRPKATTKQAMKLSAVLLAILPLVASRALGTYAGQTDIVAAADKKTKLGA